MTWSLLRFSARDFPKILPLGFFHGQSRGQKVPRRLCPEGWCRDISDTFHTKIEVIKKSIQTDSKQTVCQTGFSVPYFKYGKGFAMSHKPTISVTPRGDAHMTLLLFSLKKELNGVWNEHLHSAQSKGYPSKSSLWHNEPWLSTFDPLFNGSLNFTPHHLASRFNSEVTNLRNSTLILLFHPLGFFAPRFRPEVTICSTKAVDRAM